MPATVSATDVAAITAAVLEQLKKGVAAAVTQTLGQHQGSGTPSKRSRSKNRSGQPLQGQQQAAQRGTADLPPRRSRSCGVQQRSGSQRPQRARDNTPAKAAAAPSAATTEDALLVTIAELRGTIGWGLCQLGALRGIPQILSAWTSPPLAPPTPSAAAAPRLCAQRPRSPSVDRGWKRAPRWG